MRLWYPHMCRPHTLLPETTSVITSRHCRMTCNKTKWSNCGIWRSPDALIFDFFFLSLIYVKVLCWFLSNGYANLLSLRFCFPFVCLLVSACPWRLFIGFCTCYAHTKLGTFSFWLGSTLWQEWQIQFGLKSLDMEEFLYYLWWNR